MSNNIILSSDSYKVSHRAQYPSGTTRVFSFFESRGGLFDRTVFFGLQYIINKYLAGRVVTQEAIEEAGEIISGHLGAGFDDEPWQHILKDHGGYLPLEIRAVEEGSLIPTGNVLMTVENTCDKCFWLTNYVETLLVRVWYPSTVATQSREMKRDIMYFRHLTGANPLDVDFSLHDFGARGSTTGESAALGGAAHLISFLGSDTMEALILLRQHYGADMPGFSIPAAEHSTITSWGRDNEYAAFQNMLDTYPTGLVAVVSDSYNIFEACRAWTSDRFLDQIKQRDGKLVIRPDSGEPLPTILKILDILHQGGLGYYPNDKGYKTLHPNVGLIQGDGINKTSARAILQGVADAGWSTDVLALGSGGGLLQNVNRDTSEYAFKASAILVNGGWRDVYKAPIGDENKRSKKGKLRLVRKFSGEFRTIDSLTYTGLAYSDQMHTVFRNGKMPRGVTLEQIRERAKVTLQEALEYNV